MPASTLTCDCSIASLNSILFNVTDGEESCYDHEVKGQSLLDNSEKLMDILGNTPVCTKRLFANIKIKKNALQEIAEFLKAAHGQKFK